MKISIRELSKVTFSEVSLITSNFSEEAGVGTTRHSRMYNVCQEKFVQKIVKLRIFVAILFFVALEKRPFSLCRVAYDGSYIVVHKVLIKFNLVKLGRDLIP